MSLLISECPGGHKDTEVFETILFAHLSLKLLNNAPSHVLSDSTRIKCLEIIQRQQKGYLDIHNSPIDYMYCSHLLRNSILYN